MSNNKLSAEKPVNRAMKRISKFNHESATQYRKIATCADLLGQYSCVAADDWNSEHILSLILHLFSERFDVDSAKSFVYEQLTVLATTPGQELLTTLPNLKPGEVAELLQRLILALEDCRSIAAIDRNNSSDYLGSAKSIASILMECRFVVIHNTVGRNRNRA